MTTPKKDWEVGIRLTQTEKRKAAERMARNREAADELDDLFADAPAHVGDSDHRQYGKERPDA